MGLKLTRILLLSFAIVLFTGTKVFSIDDCGSGRDPYILPDNFCSSRFGPGNEEDLRTFDANCQANRILNKDKVCCVSVCKGEIENIDNIDDAEGNFLELINFFGQSIRIKDGTQLKTFVNLILTSTLGGIGSYALFRGVFLSAIQLSKTTKGEDIKKITEEIRYMFMGVAIAFSFMIILQLVASALGLGSLNELILIGNPGSTNIIINSN